MKIDRITYIKTFQVGLSNWEKVGMEASLQDGDIYGECFDELKEEVERFHRLSNPQLYKNGNESLVTSFNPQEKIIDRGEERKQERVVILMSDCENLTELAKFKDQCTTPELNKAYMQKVKELTS